MPTTNAQVPVRDYLSRVPARLRPTMEAGRRVIRANAPRGTREMAFRKWPIHYSLADTDVCGIGDYPRWVSVYFFRGAEMDDPDGVLEGSGKGMRHVKLREPKDANSAALKRLIKQAFRMGGVGRTGREAT